MDYNKNEYFGCKDDNHAGQSCSVPYSCCIDPDKLSVGWRFLLSIMAAKFKHI